MIGFMSNRDAWTQQNSRCEVLPEPISRVSDVSDVSNKLRFEALNLDWSEEAGQVTSLQLTHGP